jgi:hypothetical protein
MYKNLTSTTTLEDVALFVHRNTVNGSEGGAVHHSQGLRAHPHFPVAEAITVHRTIIVAMRWGRHSVPGGQDSNFGQRK